MFDEVIEIIRNYTNNWSLAGIIKLAIDLLLVIVLLFVLYKLLRPRTKGYKLLAIGAIITLVLIISYFLRLEIFLSMFQYLLFWSLGLIVIIYNQEIRHSLDFFFAANKNLSSYSNVQEKKEVITILSGTADFLSKRSVGALITIEREDNLNTYIDKAIEINGIITQELLTTIFTPGTACHDGAVIIRKNNIMCAGAYFPSTDKYDVPKSLGTRHRAAIGISERTDAFTIIVSEETGNISVTLDGTITPNINLERLEEMLDRYLINK